MVREFLGRMGATQVISGGCRGADKISAEVAEELRIPCRVFPAEWDKHGKAAGPIRNAEMLEENPDLVLAFHDNIESSKGTKDMVRRAKDKGFKVVLASHTKIDFV